MSRLRFAACVLVLAAHPGADLPRAATPDLTFEQRVAAQRAIEQVYYAHQIDARLPFDQAVPPELLERKVRDYLRQSAALEQRWGEPITAAMLLAETQRIAQSTRMPERLLELYAALGNDPVLIQECLARPALADRLVRARFAAEADAGDGSREEEAGPELADALGAGALVQRKTWSEWWRDSGATFDTNAVRTVASPALGVPQPLTDGCQFWDRSGALAPQDNRWGHTAVWTGSRMIVWGGSQNGLNTGVRYDPVTDTTVPVSTVGAPSARQLHTAVWTGNRMIVWGGAASFGRAGDGGLYEPATDSWTPLPTAGAPSARFYHTAVWTGSLMLIWGGYSAAGYEATGARFDPSTNQWSPISTNQAPAPRYDHSAVWTGSTMIVWGGDAENTLRSGGRYDPLTNSWSPTSTLNAPSARGNHTAVWASNRMIIWGGWVPTDTGALYDPANDTWSEMSLVNAPAPRAYHTAVVDSSGMIIWGGIGYYGPPLQSGGRYDLASGTWTPLPVTGAPAGRTGNTAVWTGSQMIIWGGSPQGGGQLYGRYDPAAGTWTTSRYIAQPTNAPGVWTGSLMIIGSGVASLPYNSEYPPLERYDPVLDLWTPATRTNSPAYGPGSGPAVWTGHEVIVAGGRYDPAADSWSAISTINAPPSGQIALWTGSQMLLWGGSTGGRYDPVTDTWTPITQTGAPPSGSSAGVWTGSRMVVLTAIPYEPFVPLEMTGGRYDPVSDTWSPMSASGIPSWREGFRAVWANGRMVIAGGVLRVCNYVLYGCQRPADWEIHYPGSAGSYDPENNTWTHLAAPVSGEGMSAVSTGTEAIFWGGAVCVTEDQDFDCVWYPQNSGIRINPQTGSAAQLSTVNAPSPRSYSAAVWTGVGMIVWGGWGGTAPNPRDGGSLGLQPLGPDADGDGFSTACDCDDTRASVRPFGAQICSDGLNNDCLDPRWPALADTNEADDDADGLTECSGDCDDGHASVYRGAPEVCDGLNNDCSDFYWPTPPPADRDLDNDGVTVCAGDCNDSDYYVRPGAPQICGDGRNNDCLDPLWPAVPSNERDLDNDGFTGCAGDCDDTRASVRPGAPQVCDGVNNNCLAFGYPSLSGTNDGDDDTDGYSECQGDCNDGAAATYPGAPEACDFQDNNCNGSTDEGVDGDHDGYSIVCDCNDGNVSIFPGAPQVCDGVNNNCTAPGYPSTAGTNESDDDADTFTECQGDCQDGNPSIRPGAPESCNLADDDCDGAVDEGFDIDGDNFTPCAGDCNDGNPAVFPGAPQVCDGVNNNCAAQGYPSLAGTNEADDDADSYSECQGDCSDFDPSRNPGALELCDGFDNNCDGQVDNDNDADGDGQTACAGDCQPANSAVYAGAPQVCDGVNNDCATFNWPQLAFTSESDDDADGLSECQQDCNDTDGSVWTAPSEPIDLVLSYDVTTGETSLAWSPPSLPGGSIVYYDVLRTRNKSNFVSPTVCQEFNDAGDTASIDTVVPIAGTGFFYLVRAENSCPGSSRAGSGSNGVAIPARSCP